MIVISQYECFMRKTRDAIVFRVREICARPPRSNQLVFNRELKGSRSQNLRGIRAFAYLVQ